MSLLWLGVFQMFFFCFVLYSGILVVGHFLTLWCSLHFWKNEKKFQIQPAIFRSSPTGIHTCVVASSLFFFWKAAFLFQWHDFEIKKSLEIRVEETERGLKGWLFLPWNLGKDPFMRQLKLQEQNVTQKEQPIQCVYAICQPQITLTHWLLFLGFVAHLELVWCLNCLFSVP